MFGPEGAGMWEYFQTDMSRGCRYVAGSGSAEPDLEVVGKSACYQFDID